MPSRSVSAAKGVPQRILILRLGAMGDILHALPAVSALRAALPTAEIGWVVEPRWAALLRAESAAPAQAHTAEMPVVDEIFPAGARRWSRAPLAGKTWREISELRRVLRGREYDVAIDLQGAVRSGWIGKLAHARELVGEQDPRERVARLLFDRRVATQGVHVVEQALEVTSVAVGMTLAKTTPWLPVDAEAEQWRDVVAGGASYVVINPGAGWGAKRWPPERYGLVARALVERGYEVFVNASPEERELGSRVAEASGGAAGVVVCSIGELTSLLRRASLFIGGDTGPLHLAAALECACVGIYGPTDPARNGPYGTRSRVLRHPESRRDHSRRDETEAGLLTITVDDVLGAADELLGEGEAAGG